MTLEHSAAAPIGPDEAEAILEQPPIVSSRRGGAGPFLAMLAGNACLAFGPWLVRLADVGPVAAGFWRLAIAAPLLALIARRTWGQRPASPLTVIALVALAGLMFAGDLAAWHAGILRTRLANATLFGNATAFFFPIYGFVVARRLPGPVQAGALLLAALGIALLLGRSSGMSHETLVGDALCILAGLLYTGYMIGVERGQLLLGPWATLAVATLAGILPLLLAALALGETVIPHDPTPLVMLALGSQVIGQGLIVYAIGKLSPLVIGLGLLTQPVVAATIGWSVYGERLGPADLAGAAMIGTALVLVRLGR